MKLTNNKSRGLRDRLFSLSTTGTCLIWIGIETSACAEYAIVKLSTEESCVSTLDYFVYIVH